MDDEEADWCTDTRGSADGSGGSGAGSSGAAPIGKKVIKKVLDRHKLRKKYQLDLFKEV